VRGADVHLVEGGAAADTVVGGLDEGADLLGQAAGQEQRGLVEGRVLVDAGVVGRAVGLVLPVWV
jgi:hypothetical protein